VYGINELKRENSSWGWEGKKRKEKEINKKRQYKEKCLTYAVISAHGLICICSKSILMSVR